MRPQRLLGEALEFSAQKYPDNIVVIYKGVEYSYQSLYDCAQRFANYLVNEGIKKGDRIAIYLNNSWQSAIAVYGITLAGGVFLVINPGTKAEKLNYILNDCGAKMVITEGKLSREFSIALEGLKCVEQVIISGKNKIDIENNIILGDFEKIIKALKSR